jgi:hypothetical protein
MDYAEIIFNQILEKAKKRKKKKKSTVNKAANQSW